MAHVERTLEELGRAWKHIQYEVSMLAYCTRALIERAKDLSPEETNATLEAFAAHVGTITAFLYPALGTQPDAILASTFVRDAGAWETARGALPVCLEPVRAGTYPVLDYRRADIGPVAGTWNVREIARTLGEQLGLFMQHVRDEIPVISGALGRVEKGGQA